MTVTHSSDVRFFSVGRMVSSEPNVQNLPCEGVITIYGTGVDGEKIIEELHIPPQGMTVVSENRFKEYSIGPPLDYMPGKCTFEIEGRQT
jgi:hypothetical protein